MMKTTNITRVFGLLFLFLMSDQVESGEINGKTVQSNPVEKKVIGTSSFRIMSDPPGATVYINREKAGVTPFIISANDSCLQMIIMISKRFFIAQTDTISLIPGNVTKKTYKLRPGGVITVPKFSQTNIKINDRPIEQYLQTHLNKFISVEGIEYGKYHLSIERKDYVNWEEDVFLSPAKPIKTINPLMQKKPELIYRESVKRSVLFPGLGQLHSHEYLKGSLLIGLTGTGLYYSNYFSSKYDRENKTYQKYLSDYQSAVGLTNIDKYRELSQKSRDKLLDYRRQFFWTAGSTLATYLLNIADIKWFNPIVKN